MASVTLLFIHDGRRRHMDACLASALKNLPMFDEVVWVDDSEHRLGFAGAIQNGWRHVQSEWVFHLEQDFLLLEPVPIDEMIELLLFRPHLAQVALKRQPVNEQEKAAGGIVELDPDAYTECHSEGLVWTEHRKFFTTNPSLYSSDLCRRGWPREPLSEGIFTHRLLTDPDLAFAFWGGKEDPPRVEHIGHRGGWGY